MLSYLLMDNFFAKILNSHVFPEQKFPYMNIEQAWLSLRAKLALFICFIPPLAVRDELQDTGYGAIAD